MTVHVLTGHQFPNQRLIDRGLSLEVERVQRLDQREPRSLDPPLGRTLLAIDQFTLDQTQQIRREVTAVLRARRGHQGILPQDGRQPQLLPDADATG